MPLYDFECAPCAYYTEIKQGMHDPSVYECPHCNNNTLVRVIINAPSFMVRGEAKTIGQLADKNTRNMGTYEFQEKSEKDGIKKDPTDPRKAMHKKINSMTPEQKVNWIKNGD